MGHRVRVNAGKGPVSLPNKTVLKAGEETVLTDAQFAAVSSQVGSGKLLTDVGTEAAPGEVTGGGTGDVTSAQLASAVSTLQTALGLKQDSSTAATDSEVTAVQGALTTLISAKADSTALTSAVSTLTTALGLKQDASTAATDAEVASIQSALNALITANTTAIGTKQDASTAATDAELASATGFLLRPWTANTTYTAGQWIIAPGGYPAQRIANGTSGTTYDPTQWTEYGGGKEIGSAVLTSSFVPGSNAVTDVTGMSIMVPANSGNVLIWFPGGVSLTITTGTNASSVAQRVSVYITDDLNPTIQDGFASWTVYGTGTSQSPVNNVALGCLVANNSSDRTYRMQIQVQRLGTSSATGSINAGGGVFPNLSMQAVRR